MNPPVPYQAQKESLGAQNNGNDHPKNPKFFSVKVIVWQLYIQREDSYSRSLTWLVKTNNHRSHVPMITDGGTITTVTTASTNIV
jgi:hypothetical protein